MLPGGVPGDRPNLQVGDLPVVHKPAEFGHRHLSSKVPGRVCGFVYVLVSPRFPSKGSLQSGDSYRCRYRCRYGCRFRYGCFHTLGVVLKGCRADTRQVFQLILISDVYLAVSIKWGVLLVGVLMIRALLFGIHGVWAPSCM